MSARDQFTVRYSLYDVHSSNSRGAGGLSAPSASAGLDNTDQTVAVSNILTLSSRTVNETRGQFTNSTLQALPTDPLGPAVSIAGVATFGTLSGSPTGRRNKLYEVVDNLSHHAGAHAFRVGVDFLYNDSTITFPRAIRGSYTFSSLANFLTGTYNNAGFTQTFGNTVVAQTNPNAGFYAQDEWKVNRRFDPEPGCALRPAIPGDDRRPTRNNLSPRLGFAWTPFRSRDTVVRGSFGLFYDRVPLRALANALLSARNTTDPANLSQIEREPLAQRRPARPLFPNILSAAIPTGVLVNFTTMDRRMQNAYSEQGSIEIEHQPYTQHHARASAISTCAVCTSSPPSTRTCPRAPPPAPTTDAGRTRATPTTASIRRWRIPTTTGCTFPSYSVP